MGAEDLKIQVGTPGETQDERVVSSGRAVNIHKREVERHRVTCPYCLHNNGGIGYSIIEVHRVAGAAQVKGLADPHRCNFCKRWFKVKVTMKLEGEPFDASMDLSENQRNKELTNGS